MKFVELIVTFGIVACAGWYLFRSLARTRRSSGGCCGSGSGCCGQHQASGSGGCAAKHH